MYAAFGIQPRAQLHLHLPTQGPGAQPTRDQGQGKGGSVPHPQERNSAPASSPGRAHLYFPEVVSWEPWGRVASAINQVFLFPWSFDY